MIYFFIFIRTILATELKHFTLQINNQVLIKRLSYENPYPSYLQKTNSTILRNKKPETILQIDQFIFKTFIMILHFTL